MGCEQLNVPSVDNTALDCDEFVNSICITVKQLASKIKNLEGENLDKFIERLNYKITLIDNTDYAQNKKIKNIEQRLKALEDGEV